MLKGDFQGPLLQWLSMIYQPLANSQDVQVPLQIKCVDFAGRRSQTLLTSTMIHGNDVCATNTGQLQKNGEMRKQS